MNLDKLRKFLNQRERNIRENDIVIKAYYHTLEELEISNIWESITRCEFERLKIAHDSIHEFIYLAPLCFPLDGSVSWHQKSAFLVYHFEAFYSAHRSLIEALTGYYNAGYTLLRNTLELLLRGVFWECLAHKRFRENARVLAKRKRKVRGERRNILDWLNEIFKLKPEVEDDFERISAAIFDKIAPIFEDKDLCKLIPDLKTIVEQLTEWSIFEPIPNPVELVYENIYRELSFYL